MAEMAYKAGPVEFKATGDKGEYEGHFSIFGNVDDGGDVMQPGAFLKTIQERKSRVKVFYAHDWEKLIGPPPDVLQEDATGLFAAGRLTLDSFWGREAWALMKDNALTEGSIGYGAVKFDWEDTGPNAPMVRNLREVKLYEISPVPLGMNPLTNIRAVKNLLANTTACRVDPDMIVATLASITHALKTGDMGPDWAQVVQAVEQLDNAVEAMQKAAEPIPDHSALTRRLRAAEMILAR